MFLSPTKMNRPADITAYLGARYNERHPSICKIMSQPTNMECLELAEIADHDGESNMITPLARADKAESMRNIKRHNDHEDIKDPELRFLHHKRRATGLYTLLTESPR